VKAEKNENKSKIFLLGSSHGSKIGLMLQETWELHLTRVVFSNQMLFLQRLLRIKALPSKIILL
jgi:hypothetical protein